MLQDIISKEINVYYVTHLAKIVIIILIVSLALVDMSIIKQTFNVIYVPVLVNLVSQIKYAKNVSPPIISAKIFAYNVYHHVIFVCHLANVLHV